MTRLIALAAALLPAASSFALAPADACPGALPAIEELRREVAELKAQQAGQWMSQERAESIRAVVADVLSDSGSRTSFQSTAGTTSGHAGGFFVSGADGSFLVRLNALEQVRFTWNNGYGGSLAPGTPDNQWGFEDRRTQAFLSGHVVDPTWKYVVGLAYDSQVDPYVPVALQPTLLYANVSKDLGGGLSAVVGRMNVPWTAESQLFNAGLAQMGDYSAFEYAFGAGQSTGALLRRDGADLRAQVGIFDVLGTVPVQSWDSPDNQSIAVAARGEWRLAGTWAQFDKESSFRGEQFGLVAGIGAILENGRAQNPDPGTYGADVRGITLDLRADLGGANVIGQLFWGRSFGSDAYGANLQGGVFLADPLEAFVAFTYVGMGTPSYVLQAGGNWYVAGNGLKATASVLVPINQEYSLDQGLGLGTFANNVSLVVQLQLMF